MRSRGAWWGELTMVDLAALPSSTVALLPVGATEQHGPHLPTGTDTIIASWMCSEGARRADSPAVVLPPVAVGASFGHGYDLPGTVSLTPELLAAQVVNVVLWAARTTAIHRFLVVNAHVGNAAALNVATDHLRLERPDLRTAVRDWAALDADVATELRADAEDWHANRGETAVMMAIAPDLVRWELAVAADDPDRTGSLVFRYTAARLSRNGVTGRPSEATPDLGRRLAEGAADALARLVERASVEEPPLDAAQQGLIHSVLSSGRLAAGDAHGHHQAG